MKSQFNRSVRKLMRTLITFCSLAAALWLGWERWKLADEKEKTEVHLEDVTRELEAANARIAQLSNAKPAPASKTNWVEERNRNWKSPLRSGSNENRQAVTIMPAPLYPANTVYYTDFKGRYWVDSSGNKQYVQ